jgi:hypothetical protein
MLGTVLALDLATTTGWALHRKGLERPFFGAFKLPGGPQAVGQQADALERWLRDIYIAARTDGAPITHFFFEAQHLAAKINIDTVYRLIALGGVVEKFAYQVGATSCLKVHISEWRKHFIGRGAAFGKDDPKEMAIRRCAQYGWHTDVADAAEACGILDYALTMIPDYPRPWRDKALMGGI